MPTDGSLSATGCGQAADPMAAEGTRLPAEALNETAGHGPRISDNLRRMKSDAAPTPRGRDGTWRVHTALCLLFLTAACQAVPLPQDIADPPRSDPKGVVSGTVLRRDGQPASGIDIEVQAMPGNPHSVPAVGLNTGEENTFTFLPLQPGAYRVTARSGGDVLARTVVQVEAGETHEVVLRPPREQGDDGH